MNKWYVVLFAVAEMALLMGQEPRVDETLIVRRYNVRVRVTDLKGKPLLGLKAEDFVLKNGPRELLLDKAIWVDDTLEPEVSEDLLADSSLEDLKQPEKPEAEAAQDPAAEAEEDWVAETYSRKWDGPKPGESDEPAPAGKLADLKPDGRLVVLFYQGDVGNTRRYGHMRMAKFSMDVVKGLTQRDYVAVLGFDSHLKFQLDFSHDREAIQEAIQRTLFGRAGNVPEAGMLPSLARYMEQAECLKIASCERALAYIGQALQHFEGPKTLVFVGWGLGQYNAAADRVSLSPDYHSAERSLKNSETSVISMDVSMADSHSLEVGMELVADRTGGFYVKTHRHAARAVTRLLGTISGYYVLSFQDSAPEQHPKGFDLSVKRKKAVVLVSGDFNRGPRRDKY